MKSPYLCNPNILAHPDRLVQSVALDMTAQDCYLAGSPISAEGKLANDATAIGILLYDVHKQIGGTTGVVVISGRIQQDVAAEHSGVTISADCKAALIDVTFTGDGCRMGGGGLTELPEGYPYKESNQTVIEWDGNTEGLVSVQGSFFHVSDETFTVKELPGASVTRASNDGAKTFTITADMCMEQQGLTTVTLPGDNFYSVLFVNFDDPNSPYPNGMYFLNDRNGTYTTKLVIGAEIIHTMAPEFLPAGIGGGGEFIINATIVDDMGTCTTDKTFAEMEEAYLSGKVLKVVEEVTTPQAQYTLHYYVNQYMHSPYRVLSFVNILPGAVNFHFHNIMIMDDMAQKITCTMTGEFHD